MTLVDFILLTMCVYHEARGEPALGRYAVVHVVLNRARDRGMTIEQIITEPYQFSFIDSEGNFPPVEDEKALQDCAENVKTALAQRESGYDFEGATHYHNDTVHPSWADSMTEIIKVGHHTFYRETK